MHPLIEIAIQPRRAQDRAGLDDAIQALVASNRLLAVHADPESGLTILSGDSEEQLDRVVEALGLTYDFNVGAPQVAYRETFTQPARIDHTFARQIGGGGLFAKVVLLFQPSQPGAGFSFEYATDAIPAPLAAGVLKGVDAERRRGLLAGFPVIDFKAILVDGGWHDLDSNEQTFETAARAAFRELRTKGAPILLEPIMWVEVLVPNDYLNDVIGDLKSRHGQIQGAVRREDSQFVTAMIPLSQMFGYPSQIQQITNGSGRHEMRFDHYGRAPTFESPDDPLPTAVGLRA